MSSLAGDGWLGFIEEAGGSFWDGEHGIGGAEDAGLSWQGWANYLFC
jgi:hypothetical protein